ncbi:hypothetical protein I203_100991 [Kwoniella mangroviensis CBS 8507]|uniref:uncharacterized protein n=1 Tax=Kwoniella mangroviensis CBS 8507 TaxID=1296122 RepID=UPI00080CD2BB|nr:uncharacterized protein I203_02631 [Kwoniella mangroviensis CBS 8507]OCF67972.1 hypothetical protein I203_02631 [Kwoniella mangroviensis CBS 8507]
MAEQTMSKDELRRLRASVGSRKTSLGQELSRRIFRMEAKIRAEPNAGPFSSLENVRDYLSMQKGKDPVKIAQWWRDNQEDTDPDRARQIHDAYRYLYHFAKQCRSTRDSNNEINRSNNEQEMHRMLSRWESFRSTFGTRGADTLLRAEKHILISPYSRAFDSVQTLIHDPNTFTKYRWYNRHNSEVALEGLEYLIDVAHNERRLRDKSKRLKAIFKWKKPKLSSSEMTVSEQQSQSEADLIQVLTAEASINPFQDQFHNSEHLRGYLAQPAPEAVSAVRNFDLDTTQQIVEVIAAFAEDQRNIQMQVQEALLLPVDHPTLTDTTEEDRAFFLKAFGRGGAQTLRWLHSEISKDPHNSMFSDIPNPQLTRRFQKYLTKNKEGAESGMRYVVKSARAARNRLGPAAVEAGTTDPDGSDPVAMEESQMSQFAKLLGSDSVGMGHSGTDFIRKIKKHVSGDQFQERDFKDKDAVSRFLTSGKRTYLIRVREQKPELSEGVVDFVYRLGRKSIMAEAAQYTLPDQSEEEFQSERLKRSSQRHVTKDDIKAILTQPNWTGYTTLAEQNPTLADELLQFGVWYTERMMRGRPSDELLLSPETLQDYEAMGDGASRLTVGMYQGKRKRRRSSALTIPLDEDPDARNAARILQSLESLADWRATTEGSERGASVSGQAIDSEAESEIFGGEVDYFDENDMRQHRLMLFGLSLAGREDQEVEIQASSDPHMQETGTASEHPEEHDNSEEAANSDDTFSINTNVNESVRLRAKRSLFPDLPDTPIFRD